MNKIVVVSYEMSCEADETHFTRSTSKGAKNYEYVAPLNAKGDEKYAVVAPHVGKITNAGSLKVVRIVGWKEMSQQVYEGELKHAVAVIDVDEFHAAQERFTQRQNLLKKIEKKISEQSKIAQLKALAGDDLVAKELLEQFEKLSS